MPHETIQKTHETIQKSSRHQNIIGKFGEWLICNWLSRSNFEVALVDQTGMDIIAYNNKTKERLGISVKSRTRTSGKEKEPVNIFSNKKNDRDKLIKACNAFNCDPWIAIYVETGEKADIYLTSLTNYEEKYRIKNKATDDWKMTQNHINGYNDDPKVKHIEITFKFKKWW